LGFLILICLIISLLFGFGLSSIQRSTTVSSIISFGFICPRDRWAISYVNFLTEPSTNGSHSKYEIFRSLATASPSSLAINVSPANELF